MCLIIVGSQKPPTPKRVCRWKVCSVSREKLFSVVYPHSKNGCIAGAGTLVSSRKKTALTAAERRSECVDKGFHVYTSLSHARHELGEWAPSEDGHNVVVPVHCSQKDFVARGPLEEVYRAITITPTAFRRATRGAKP